MRLDHADETRSDRRGRDGRCARLRHASNSGRARRCDEGSGRAARRAGGTMTREDLTRRLELLTDRLMRQRLQLQEAQRMARDCEAACHQLEGAIGTVRELLDSEPVDALGPNGADPETPAE